MPQQIDDYWKSRINKTIIAVWNKNYPPYIGKPAFEAPESYFKVAYQLYDNYYNKVVLPYERALEPYSDVILDDVQLIIDDVLETFIAKLDKFCSLFASVYPSLFETYKEVVDDRQFVKSLINPYKPQRIEYFFDSDILVKVVVWLGNRNKIEIAGDINATLLFQIALKTGLYDPETKLFTDGTITKQKEGYNNAILTYKGEQLNTHKEIIKECALKVYGDSKTRHDAPLKQSAINCRALYRYLKRNPELLEAPKLQDKEKERNNPVVVDFVGGNLHVTKCSIKVRQYGNSISIARLIYSLVKCTPAFEDRKSNEEDIIALCCRYMGESVQ